MRRVVVGLLAVIAVACAGSASWAQEYERSQPSRGYAPPPRGEGYAPPPRHAMHGQPYMNIQLGLFEPNDQTDGLAGYDTGTNFGLAFGSRVSPIFAFEGTFGAYGADRGSNEVRVVPITIGGRLIIPHPFIEPYVGAGLGLYFSSLEEAPRTGFTGIDDTSADIGGYLSAGVDLWLNPRTALNFEGKYHVVEPTFQTNAGNDVDVSMGGWTVNLGVRVAF